MITQNLSLQNNSLLILGFIPAVLIIPTIVEYTTQASEWVLKNFTLEFETKYKDRLMKFSGKVSESNTAEEIVMKYFS